MQNLLLETPSYKFKKSFGGTSKSQTTQDAPWLHGLSLKRGSAQPGCILGVCGSGVPPYDFLNLYGVFDCMFCISFSWEMARTKEP